MATPAERVRSTSNADRQQQQHASWGLDDEQHMSDSDTVIEDFEDSENRDVFTFGQVSSMLNLCIM